MPGTSQKRDKAYYLNRLAKQHPEVAARVARGELTEVAAFDMTGIKPKPKPLVALRREWRKSSAAERKQFIEEVGPAMAGSQRTAVYQMASAWGRCSEAERGVFLYALLKAPLNRALVKGVLDKLEG